MIKVYFEALEGRPYVPIVASYVQTDSFFRNSPYVKRAYEQSAEQYVIRVDRPEEADFILLPHFSEHVLHEVVYIENIRKIAQSNGKKLLVFMYGDLDLHIEWPEAVVFRCSAYRSDMRANEFIMPAITEDLLGACELAIRKVPKMPVVGFVGWAGFSSFQHALKTRIKDVLLRLRSALHGKHFGHKRKGIYLRIEMLELLKKSSVVESKFIIRNKYSGSVKANPDLDVKRAREEYIENMVGSDVTLAVRGDGNFSQRFYECLSLGRIPLLVDTDNLLPFEEFIPYERFVIRVPYRDRKRAVEHILNFFSGLDDAEYSKRQHEAREYFEKYLSTTAYLRYMFAEEKLKEQLSERGIRV